MLIGLSEPNAREIFTYTFWLGARIMLEVLRGKTPRSTSKEIQTAVTEILLNSVSDNIF